MLDFHSYYQQGGRNEAYAKLAAAKRDMLRRVRGNQTSKNMQVLSDKLTKLFYPPAGDKEAQSAIENFNAILKASFEEIANKKFYEKEFNLGMDKFHETPPEPKVVQSSSYNAIHNLVIRIEKNMNTLLQADNPQVISKMIGVLEMDAQNALNILKTTLENMGSKSISFVTKKNIAVGEAYNYLRALEAIVAPGKVFNTTDMGNILEYALGLLDEDLNYAVVQTVQDAINQIGKQVQGSTPIARTAQGLHMDMYLDKKSLENITKQAMTYETKNKHTKTFYQIGDIKIQRAASINPGADKYGKIDVYKSNDLRISAKNWKSLTYKDFKTNEEKMRSVGGAKLLDALARTTNVLDYYMWLMQDEKAPESYYAIAHQTAQLSAYTDIALGFGNKSSANVLVINQRDRKRVLVIDMNQEILNAINNKPSKFVLVGYDSKAIERTSQQLGLYAQRYRGSSAKLYYTLMYDFLANQRLIVEMSSSLKT